MKQTNKQLTAFTVIELVMVIALLALISVFTYVRLRPSDYLADARNIKRHADVQQILGAINLYVSEAGNSVNDLGTIPACPTVSAIGTSSVDISTVLIPQYLAEVPFDPSVGAPSNTGYTICQPATGRAQIAAPNAESGETIVVTR